MLHLILGRSSSFCMGKQVRKEDLKEPQESPKNVKMGAVAGLRAVQPANRK